ncbi:MAG: hypothetical protein WDO17_23600 [Alphaproteobacteria bacterium]
MSTTTNSPKTPRFSLDIWAVSAAVLFIILVVAGVFPHVSW